MGRLQFKRGTTENKPELLDGEVYVDQTKSSMAVKIDSETEIELAQSVQEIVIDGKTFTKGTVYNVATGVADLTALNALDYDWQAGDMVTLGTDKTLYRYNGTAFELVNDPPPNPNVGGLLQAIALLATGDNAGILENVNLVGANLKNVYLEGANLTNANLTGANLTYANLYGANLAGAYLTGANLYGASLTGANLTDANFTGANLTDANLEGATLTYANLTDAILTGANLTSATMPTNADTKAEFKAVVGEGNWDAVTTIWTDGNPIGE